MPQVCFLSLGLGEGGVVPPLAWVWGRRGDQLMLKAGGGGRIGKWMGARWFLESTQNNGGARPHSESTQNNGGVRPHSESTQNNGGVPSSCGRFGDFPLFFMQLRVDDFQIRSR